MSTKARVIAVLILIVLVLIIGAQNNRTELFLILFWEIPINRLVLIPALFLLGMASGLLLAWSWGRKRAPNRTDPPPV